MEIVDESLEEFPQDRTETESYRQFRCTECKKHFKDDKALILHMKSHNAQRSGKSGELYVCQQCGKTAKTRQALDRHAAYHQDERPFPCEKCQQRFKNSDDRGKHYRRLKRDGKFDHACTVCHKHFKTDELLRKHQVMLGCHSKTDVLEKKETQDENNEIDEEEIMVEGEELTQFGDQDVDSISDIKLLICPCKMCESDFPSPESLKQHYRNHHNDCKRQVCIQCGQTLSSRDSLNRHYNIFHQDNFAYPCKQCDQKFKIKESLLRHIKFVHTDGGYMCAICKHVFSQPVNLKKHMIVHSTKKDLICEGCGKTFKWKQTLEKHRLLSCYKPMDKMNKYCAKKSNEIKDDNETEEIVNISKNNFERKGSELNNLIQSEINVPYDKTVESFDAMDLILNSNDEVVPLRSRIDIHHNKTAFPEEKSTMETFDLNDEQLDKVLDHVTETNTLLSKESTNSNENMRFVDENHLKTNKTMHESLKVTNNDDIPKNIDRSQQNIDEVNIDSNLSVTSDKGQSLRNVEDQGCEIGAIVFYETGENLSFVGPRKSEKLQKDYTEEYHLDDLFSDKCCPTSKKNSEFDNSDHLHCNDDKVNETEDGPTNEMSLERCKKKSECDASDHLLVHDDKLVLTGGESFEIRQTNERENMGNHQRDSSLKTKDTFKPSNLPRIMAPLGTTCQLEKPDEVRMEINVDRIKETSQSVETKTQHQRVQKNPFIIQNVAANMDTGSFSSKSTTDWDVLDLSTTQSSRRSPRTEEIPSGKFSLIKHMLSLQNEEHFDKALFDNPLYNRPSRIHDFKKLAEMHKISNNVNVEEYDLSAKQNIPIHWLGLSRQNKVDSNGCLINMKQSCDGKASTSTSSSECFEKRVPKRPLNEDRQINKIQKIGGRITDKGYDKGCDVNSKREFSVNKSVFIENEGSGNRNSTSFDRNQENCKSGCSMGNGSFNVAESSSKTITFQNDYDLISSKANASDSFLTNVMAGPQSRDKLLSEGTSNSVLALSKQHTLNTNFQKSVSTKKIPDEESFQTKHIVDFEESKSSNDNEKILKFGSKSKSSIVLCEPSYLRPISNNYALCRSNSENFIALNERPNSSHILSQKAYNSGSTHGDGLSGTTLAPGFSLTSLANKLVTCRSPVPATYTPHVMAATYTPHVMAATYTPHVMAATYTPHVMAATYTPHVMAATYTPHVMARSISWPQPFNEDSFAIRKYDSKKNDFKDDYGSNVTQSQSGTASLSHRKDQYSRLTEEKSIDYSELLLAESLDIIGDSSKVQTSTNVKPLHITTIHSSHPVSFLTTTSQTISSNHSPVCSKSGLTGIPFQSHSNHTASQQNVVNSGFNSAIEISNHSVTLNQSQFYLLNHNSKRQDTGFDGPRSENKTGIVATLNEFNIVNSLEKTFPSVSENRILQKSELCNDLFQHNSDTMFQERYFACNKMSTGFSKDLLVNKKTMSPKAQEELSVVDLLQVPSGTSKIKKHQNIERFLKHCLD